jgi:23S rRNA pseudouridine1911/1915/1917 synthase
MDLRADREERLDKFLARSLPNFSRTKLAALAASGGVLVEGRPQKASFMLQPGLEVKLEVPADSPAQDLSPADIPIEIVYEDEHFLVVNKPRGLAVHPAATLHEPSLVNALLGRSCTLSTAAGDFRPGIVHRLDKETTGLLIVAKGDLVHAHLARQIEGKSAERRYVAVVAGDLAQQRFTVDAPLGRDPAYRTRMAVVPGGKRAVTHVKVLRRLDAGTLIAVRLETGRTHQIRVHLRAVGHPVLGDTLYAPKEWRDGPIQLHAAFLEIEHPMSGQRMAFYVAPPPDFVGAEFVSQGDLEPF